MKSGKESFRKGVIVLESLGLGLFYVAMLAFFLYPVVDSAGYLA